MDRRTALRKIAVGGASTIGASVIISSPAFADGGSNSARPPVPIPTYGLPTNVTETGFDLQITFPAATCPVGGVPAKREFRADLGTSTAEAGVTGFGVGVRVPTSGLESFSFTWGTDPSPLVRLAVRLRYTCPDYQTGQVAWRCEQWVLDATRGAGPAFTPMLADGLVQPPGVWCDVSPSYP